MTSVLEQLGLLHNVTTLRESLDLWGPEEEVRVRS